MITLHLVRHGETVWHAENRYAGISDIDLTARGREQARALIPWAESAGIDLVVSSDLRRAQETARPVAAAVGTELRVDAGLREVDFGRGEGMTRDEMTEAFPDGLAEFLAAPASSPLPGGELGASAADRGLWAILRLSQDVSDDSTMLVVGHTTLIRLMLCRTLGIPLDDYRRRFPRLDNARITTLTAPRASTVADLAGAGALLRYNSAPPGSSRL
ncbi:histidine phosphatase family protein [Microbacterium sp.]|uniref:histidine phosphatase family protein n=1 Tax=Microbacterium sp. TaxID=51671 RepID=UPI003F70683D